MRYIDLEIQIISLPWLKQTVISNHPLIVNHEISLPICYILHQTYQFKSYFLHKIFHDQHSWQYYILAK